uniref:Homeobox domain-containing protein n=1 Tax=Caenorhabditis tropicalis TaxID=1561998 RepID=A0A1I7T3A3_9PELO
MEKESRQEKTEAKLQENEKSSSSGIKRKGEEGRCANHKTINYWSRRKYGKYLLNVNEWDTCKKYKTVFASLTFFLQKPSIYQYWFRGREKKMIPEHFDQLDSLRKWNNVVTNARN